MVEILPLQQKHFNIITGRRSGYIDHTAEYSLVQHRTQSAFFASNTKSTAPTCPNTDVKCGCQLSHPFFFFKCLPTLVFCCLPVHLLLHRLLPILSHLQYQQWHLCINHLHLHLFHYQHNSSAVYCMLKLSLGSVMHPNMRMTLIFKALGQMSLQK